jgi:glutamate/tyrosine decarboxylase-like PLP-dependent enzyme
MATEGTKFQINYKLNDGTLINLYAASVTELESGLADLAMNAMNIRATGLELSGGAAPAPAPTVAAVAQAFNATPVAAAPAPAGGANSCRHGVMAFREGTSSKGPWKGYMCAAPKGATDKCDTIWVR